MDNPTNFSNYRVESTKVNATGAVSTNYMAGVFMWMFAALSISTIFALLFANNASLMNLLVQVDMRGHQAPTLLGMQLSLPP